MRREGRLRGHRFVQESGLRAETRDSRGEEVGRWMWTETAREIHYFINDLLVMRYIRNFPTGCKVSGLC
jgi:hypothetical protein